MQGPQDIGWRSLRGLLQALIPALLMNIHIVGLNQIFDVEIDKVRPLELQHKNTCTSLSGQRAAAVTLLQKVRAPHKSKKLSVGCR